MLLYWRHILLDTGLQCWFRLCLPRPYHWRFLASLRPPSVRVNTFDTDSGHPLLGKAQLLGGGKRQVNYAVGVKRAPIINPKGYTTPIFQVGHFDIAGQW